MRVLRFISWLGYLLWQILLGSARVVASAWSPTRRARPCIVRYPLHCDSDLEIALFASAITITPGTLVLGVAAEHQG